MKNLIKSEELAMLAVSIYVLYLLDAEWWLYLILAVGPDISMLGYAAGNKTGAMIYNLFHHKGVAIVVFFAGVLLNQHYVEMSGVILFGHSSMDRLFGYGLKYDSGFAHTHLGEIGKQKETV